MRFIVLIILLIAVSGYIFNQPKKEANVVEEPNNTNELVWPDGRDNLQRRLDELNMPALKEEGFAIHTHQHLDIFIGGKKINIPEDIGVGPDNQFIAQIHTHDKEGIIHIESPTVEKFNLGQFFDIWGVRLDKNCIGDWCSDSQNRLEIYSNGELIEKDPRELELIPRQQITIVYGDETNKPGLIPSSYEFPKGY